MSPINVDWTPTPLNPTKKEYRPRFVGKAEIRGGGGGGGTKKEYEWTVNAIEPVTEGKIIVKMWFVAASSELYVDGSRSIPLGPAVTPESFSDQVMLQELCEWWFEQCGGNLWDSLFNFLQNSTNGHGTLWNQIKVFMQSVGEVIQDFASDAGRFTSLVNAVLTAGANRPAVLERVEINGDASGPILISYMKNGVEQNVRYSVTYSSIGGESRELTPVLAPGEALRSQEVQREWLAARKEWVTKVKRNYKDEIIKFLRSKYGNRIIVEFK